MRKPITFRGGISLLLPAALLCALLTGCQRGQEKAAEVSAPPSAVTEPEPVQTPAPSAEDENTVDKEETVYVQAEADGSPKKSDGGGAPAQ